jgi:hypothetical protein
MNIYRVEGGVFRAGPGTRLLLLAAVAIARLHNLERCELGTAEAGLVMPRVPIELKAGELVGLDELPKAFAGVLQPVTDGKRGSPETAMLAAAAAIDDAAEAAAAAERERTSPEATG